MINVLIADDHQLVLDGLESLITPETDMKIVGRAENGKKALKILSKQKADVILLDVRMPEMNGIKAAQAIRQHFKNTKILMLSMHDEKNIIMNLMNIGVHGYILKNANKQELLNAIRTVYYGGTYYSPDVLKAIARNNIRFEPAKLTKREKQILGLIGECLTSKQISEKLYIAVPTVETHCRNLMHKLKCANRMELVKYAVQNNYAA